MRWRGVSVMSRLGQLDSQKPHSMQRSTIALAGGLGFRCFKCASGSCARAAQRSASLAATASTYGCARQRGMA